MPRKPKTKYDVEKASDCCPIVDNDTTRTINRCNMQLFSLPAIDYHNEEDFIQRIAEYFQIVGGYNLKPTLAGLGLALGVNRNTVYKWCNGIECSNFSDRSHDILKKAYQLINSGMEDYLMNGQINPVAGIFLMKNNFNYKDQSEVIQISDNKSDENDKIVAKYDAIDVEFTPQ